MEAPVPEPEAPDLRPPEQKDLDRYLQTIKGEGRLFTTIETNVGAIECQLLPEVAPKAVANFVGLATGQRRWKDPETEQMVEGRRFYDGVTFHRVMAGFIIQAGDRTGTGKGGPGYTFADEFSESQSFDAPGKLALANTGANTNGSQFFITERAAPHLTGRHTIFGECKNLEVVHKISTAPASNDGQPEVPVRISTIRFEQRS